jgi:benzoyl-CoA reductase/2-hydroxyglutaryl-CoA dehydratase subunit BcrC/BadD/HgdB
MGLAPFVAEAIPIILPNFDDEKTEHFIDVCENAGYPGDICALPKTTIGMVLEEQLPPPKAIVTSNSPCDGGMASYAVMEEKYKVPVFRLDLPYNFTDQRGLDYYLGELKRMIAWLEEVYSVKMNYNRLREVCEEHNRMWQYTLDLWDLQRLSPAPIGGETLLFAHLSYQTGGGTRATTRLMRDMLRIARRSIERDGGGIPNERHRAILWNPPPLVYPAMFPWMEKEYGAITVMDMLSYKKNQYIDTSSVESMMRDLARTLAFGPMAQHTRGPCENFFTDLFLMYESFNADMIIMAGHTGCKNTRALLGMFKELCRKRSIPLIIFDYDLSDTRPMPPSGIRKQISDFMENIMGERKGAL